MQRKVRILFAFSGVDCDGVGRNLVLWPIDFLVTCSRTVLRKHKNVMYAYFILLI